MGSSSVIGVLLFSATAGLSAYALTCAYHVWQVRHSGKGQKEPGRWLGRIAGVMAAGGLACLLVGEVLRLVSKREGLLAGEGLYSVTLPFKGLQVKEVTAATFVQPGALLVRFGAAEREAAPGIAGDGGSLPPGEKTSLSALLPDSDLARQVQETGAWRRQLQMSLTDLEIETVRMERESLSFRLNQQDQLCQARLALDTNREQLRQAQTRLEFLSGQLARDQALRQNSMLSLQDYDISRRDRGVAEAEVEQLKSAQTNLLEREAQLEQGLAELKLAHEHQTQSLSTGREAIQAQMRDLGRREEELQRLTDTLKITAPFAGKVVFRDPSPRAAALEAPLVVLAPAQGLRVKLRLSQREFSRLRSSQENITCELPQDFGTVLKKQVFLERQFSGKITGGQPMPQDHGFVLAELGCEPPAEAVRALAAGEQLPIRILWSPPLWRGPEFWTGGLLLTLGFAGLLYRRPVRAEPQVAAAPVAAAPASAPPTAEIDVSDQGLCALGEQWRRGLLGQTLEPAWIQVAELALEQGPVRGVRLFSVGLRWDEELCCQVEQWAAKPLGRGAAGTGMRETIHRTLKVLLLTAPEAFASRIRQAEQALAQCSPESPPRPETVLRV